MSTERRDGDNFDTPKLHSDFLSELVGVRIGGGVFSEASTLFKLSLSGTLC